jgi:hypothetical protein
MTVVQLPGGEGGVRGGPEGDQRLECRVQYVGDETTTPLPQCGHRRGVDASCCIASGGSDGR